MLVTLINKELKGIILSPKFTATFAICSLLLILSVFTGIREYQISMEQYQTAQQISDQQLREQTSWDHLSQKVYRAPDPVGIFAGGLNNDIGRWSIIHSGGTARLEGSAFSDDPVFAVFRLVDFTFIVYFVLSLFAILFTYDAINGEREEGTLRLVFSNPVPRAKYLLAKFLGAWIGLVIPICIPIALSLLLVILMGVPLTLTHWAKIVSLIGVSLLYFTFYIIFGVFVSTLSKRSSVSFLVALISWVVFVLIIPRAGAMAAGQITSVPRVAEIEGQRDSYAKDLWNKHNEALIERWEMRESEGFSDDHLDDDAMWARMEEEDAARKEVEKAIDLYEQKLFEDLRHRKDQQERLALILSRFSPSSAFRLAAVSLSGTGISLKSRYLEAMANFRTQFVEFADAKHKEGGEMPGMIMVEASSESGISIKTSRDNAGLDVSGVPKFIPPVAGYLSVLASIVIDIGLICLWMIFSFAGAFVAFIRYDVR